MKRFLSFALVVVIAFLCLAIFSSCAAPEPREITCAEIISAYENAGCYVVHGEHKSEADAPQRCYIKASLSEAQIDSDYIYFITCFTEEQAEQARKVNKYNALIWFYAAVNGEARWLKTGTYGKIEYSYYNSKLIKPFDDLVKQKQ